MLNSEILFPTFIYYKDLPDSYKLNQYLFENIKSWYEQDKIGVERTNSGGWHSKTDMNHRPEYEPLIRELFLMLEECNKDQGITNNVVLGNMWANINPPMSYNRTHIHPNSLWSGVYYVTAPKNSGDLFVEDPRPGPNINLPNKEENIPKNLWRVISYTPKAGRLIMFPSWLPHGVNTNLNKEKGRKNLRISISFNFVIHNK